jgi:lysophospholipase L1-like esterase
VSAALGVALLLAIGPFLLSQSAEGGPVSDVAPDGIVVVGDSITARYDDDPGSARQGWWSMVGRRIGAPVETFAQSGSGYLRRGGRCDGTTFDQREKALEGSPSIVIIEGGRNDWAVCRDDRVADSTNAEIAEAVDAYLDLVQKQLPSSTRVVVVGPPWGPLQPLERLRVTPIVEQAAKDHDMEYVDTSGTLPPEHVVDGVHPNRAGSIAIAKRVIATLE